MDAGSKKRRVSALGISNVITLLGGVALFLFGMSLMGDGLKKVAGNRLEIILYKLSNTPLKGVLLGTAVTAVIQSSSATSVMVVGFVNSGMMKVRQAIGIVLGAILGTSVTAWIIALSSLNGSGWVSLLSTATISGVVAVAGIILYMFSKKMSHTHVGHIFLGFAVLMYGMQSMSAAVSPLRDSPAFVGLITTFSNPLIGILVGAAFTSVLQSASASIGILQALSATGAIDFSIALPVIMGIAIGAAVPVLLSTLGADVDGKRTACAYLLVDIIGVAVWSAVFYPLNAVLHFSFTDASMNAVSIAFLNSVFRFSMVVVLTPFIPALEKLISAIIRDRGDGAAAAEADITLSEPALARLEELFLAHPALAIEQSRAAVNAMARRAQQSLVGAFGLLREYSDEGFENVHKLEDIVDIYEDRIGTYLVKITGTQLSEKQTEDMSKFLHTITDFERISDHALNIAENAKEICEKKISFSDEARHEIAVITAAVSEIVDLSFDSFISGDTERAYRVEPLEELIDNLCSEMKLHHVGRIKEGVCTLTHGFVFNDLMTNYERVADHCSNIAVAMIELESDAFDTHQYLSSLRQLRSHSFDRYFEEYRQKFSI